ncbi:MAG: hypothetical protein Q8R28_05340, partial [Dehalococcoidia bacterium]|nr:hypothetical protein [Dehalococcoidia bacterium]
YFDGAHKVPLIRAIQGGGFRLSVVHPDRSSKMPERLVIISRLAYRFTSTPSWLRCAARRRS